MKKNISSMILISLLLSLVLCFGTSSKLSITERYDKVTSVEKNKMRRLDSIEHNKVLIKEKNDRILDSIKQENIRPLINKIINDNNKAKILFKKNYPSSTLNVKIISFQMFPYFCSKNCSEPDSIVYLHDTTVSYYTQQITQCAIIAQLSYIQPNVGPITYKTYRLIKYYKNPVNEEWINEDTCLVRMMITNIQEEFYGCY